MDPPVVFLMHVRGISAGRKLDVGGLWKLDALHEHMLLVAITLVALEMSEMVSYSFIYRCNKCGCVRNG